ncbi:MAG: NADH:flavin oxidoreductase [Desulfobacula sp.]|jgi:2,4-dienoyl-CoA reductase-like NADH-dependent reductase (Old Yellow Enzyme family)|uniref:oxidoreductase n=1 Tax=Desulfobacula sp. TaxID=2593537 RepID=UPI001DF55691|nr:NADH:flavin oxidoreductase [Desulfobacula sp.]MBT3486263.1 NADH:flavin oxidoreductase [Desulfobacula sp.]MBT3805735.1 NADH:flavin oxidoreductase [Desulfobacula sp.]MBT4025395.1 NADH:flavin oxidoreductase [Desulfobacula sp.]MBT4200067.1 NADH:flavin oxidoreductase [Desulfobacula sp.]
MTLLNNKVTIKQMKLRNRLVLPPITTNYGSPKGFVTQNILHFYRERSKDIGLTIVEATSVHPGGCIVPNSLGFWDDSHIPGMTRLVKTIQEQGAKAVVQLNHAGPRCDPRENERQGLSPSGMAFRPDVEPIIMNTKDINQLINDFSRAAVRAYKAGFNGVEIHGAHLYLLSQFLSPLTNKRDDNYGGDAKGRATLAIEIVKKVRKSLGPKYPIFFRINAEEKIDGGQTLEDSLAIGKLLAKEGVDVFDVSLIAHGGWKKIQDKEYLVGSSTLAKDKPSGANIDFTAAFRKETGRPAIVVGKFGKGDAAVKAVENEQIEMVAIGRQMICDPLSAKKMLNGKDSEIIACDECLKCLTTIGKGSPMECKINKNLPW